MRSILLKASVALAAMAIVTACSSSGGSSSNTSPAAAGSPTSGAAAASTGGGGGGTGDIKTGLKIAVIPKQVNQPYFDAAFAGAKKACQEIQAKCDQIGPTQATGAAQTQFINSAVQQGYNAIVISAADADSVVPALKKAQSSGITVVTYDADVNDMSARSAMITPTTPQQIGQYQVKWISEAIGSGGGEIAILSAAANAANQNAWIKYMKQDLPNYPQLKLVDTVYGNDDTTLSTQKAVALMQAHPNLKGIISPTTVGIAASAKYIDSSSYKGKVQVTGLGLPSQMKSFVNDGTVKEFGLWDPSKLGYLGIYAAAEKISGANLASTGVTAGGQTYKLDGQGVVIVGPPQVFNKDNIDQFQF